MPANQEIFNEIVRRQIKLIQLSEQYGRKLVSSINATNQIVMDKLAIGFSRLPRNPLSREFNTALFDLQRAVGKLRLDGGVTESIGMKTAETFFTNEMRELSTAEAKWTQDMIHSKVGIPFNSRLPSAAALGNIVAYAPFQGQNIKQWFKTLRDNDLARIMRTVRGGVLRNQSTAAITREIMATDIPKTMRGAEMLSRTITNGISNKSKNLFYEENKDIIKGVMFVAVLDGRTTLICGALDGKKWPDPKDAEEPPLHPNCRSVLSPYINEEGIVGNRIAVGEKNFREEAKKAYVKKFVTRHGLSRRAALDRWNNLDSYTINLYMNGARNKYITKVGRNVIGKVPARVTYPEWLKTQPPEFVRDVLGRTKGDMFLSGKYKLSSFTTRTGRVRTIADLKK